MSEFKRSFTGNDLICGEITDIIGRQFLKVKVILIITKKDQYFTDVIIENYRKCTISPMIIF